MKMHILAAKLAQCLLCPEFHALYLVRIDSDCWYLEDTLLTWHKALMEEVHVNAKLLVVLLLKPKWFSIIELTRDAQSVIRGRILIGSAKFQAT